MATVRSDRALLKVPRTLLGENLPPGLRNLPNNPDYHDDYPHYYDRRDAGRRQGI